ncbi:MAG: hypothetical protein ACO3S5_02990 [Ilumatobacteraceae bacterium]|jgi:hypothetical protein
MTTSNVAGDHIHLAAVMAADTDCFQQGRKGIAYAWHELYAAAQVETIEHELSMLAPEFAE